MNKWLFVFNARRCALIALPNHPSSKKQTGPAHLVDAVLHYSLLVFDLYN